jgi:quinohemoprotein ethanol dehydrogenase
LRASSFLGNDFWYEIVLNGAMKDAGMAPFKSVLDHEDAEAIRAYVIHRAHEDQAMKHAGSPIKSALDH